MRSLRRFVALSRLERSWLWQALILLPIVRASLSVLGCRRTQAWLNRLAGRRGPQQPLVEQTAYAPVAQRMVEVAARSGIVTASCLPRALVISTLLRRSGVNATLKLGARRHLGRIEAHAWVETEHDESRDRASGAGFVPLTAPPS